MDNLEKLNTLLELMKDDTLTPKEVEKFLTILITVVKESKKEVKSISEETLSKVEQSIAYIEYFHEKQVNTIDSKINIATGQFATDLALLKDTLQKVQLIKPTDGINGNDGVDGKDGKDGSPDTAKEIADKLESLEGEDKLDFKALKNVPEFKGGRSGGVVARNIYQLGDVSLTNLANDEVLKWDDTNKLWVNGTSSSGASFATLTGSPYDNTNLTTALDLKANKSFAIAIAVAL